MSAISPYFLAGLICLGLRPIDVAARPPLPKQHGLECPPALPAEALPLARAPAGWTSSSRGGLLLHAVDISDGPPSEMAFLKPETSVAKDGATIDTWSELQLRRERGVWLVCNFGNSDQVILGQQLNANTTACTAAYKKNRRGNVDIEVRCLW